MKKIAFVLPPTYGKGLSPGWKAWLVTLLKKNQKLRFSNLHVTFPNTQGTTGVNWLNTEVKTPIYHWPAEVFTGV